MLKDKLYEIPLSFHLLSKICVPQEHCCLKHVTYSKSCESSNYFYINVTNIVTVSVRIVNTIAGKRIISIFRLYSSARLILYNRTTQCWRFDRVLTIDK